MKAVFLRLAGFTGAPILSALAPFLLLPVISRITGEDGWANFATGQSIGILGMVVVLFGWGVLGPVRIAQDPDPDARANVLRESLASRGLMTVVGLAFAGVATALITSDGYKAESVAMALAMTLGGLSPAWFCIGSAKPAELMLYDAGPKIASAVVSLPVLLVGGPILLYPILLATLTLLGAFVHARRALHGHPGARIGFRGTLAVLRRMLPTAAIDAAGNAYGSTPVPIATWGLTPAAAGSFASADRIYRVGVLVVVALGNAFQAWVLEPRVANRASRHLAAIASHAILGVFGAAMLIVLGPWASEILFGSAVAAAREACVFFGIAYFCISTATPLIRNVMIPRGRYRYVLSVTLTASVVGLATMGAGAIADSQAIVAIGVAAAEATSLILLAIPAIGMMRAARTATPVEP